MGVISDTVGTASDLISMVEEAKDRGISSLSEYTKRTLISSRVYIEDVLATDPQITSILKFANTIYGGMVLVALGLNNVISGGHTVRQMLGAVSTESLFKLSADIIAKKFGDVKPALESKDDDDAKEGSKSGSVNEKKLETDGTKLFTGRLMEMTCGSGANSAKLYFFIQLLPKILPGLVFDEFLSNNTDPSKTLRWAQWKAGEIKFWRDLVFEMDRVQKRKKALRLDKDGILREIDDHRQQGFLKKLWNWIKPAATGSTNHNTANTIMIISKRRIDRVMRDLGMTLSSFQHRQKLLSQTMSLMLIVYDPNFETIEMYLNGIQNYGQYNSQMLQAATKKDDSVDIKQLMTLIAAGNAPKF